MSAERIDVLAVMASAHKVAEDYVRDVNDGCDCIAALVAEQVIEARAAVAELIDADKEYDEAHAEFYAVAMDRETANERYMRQGRYITARKRRAAALARIGGAS